MEGDTVSSRSIAIASVTFLASLGIESLASGQPLPGEVLTFEQLPLGDLQTDPSTPAQVQGTAQVSVGSFGPDGSFDANYAADDFSEQISRPIVDVEWWGSNLVGSTQPVQQFLIEFASDVPASPGSISHPGNDLSSQIVTLGPLAPQSGTFTPTQVPSNSGQLYQYNAELADPFPEQADTVYWLKITALNNGSWGWQNRDYTIQDPYAAPVSPGEQNIGTAADPIWQFHDGAIAGNEGSVAGGPLQQEYYLPLDYNGAGDGFPGAGPSEDLAFDFYYSVPEPTSLPILAGAMFIMRRRRRV